jgi:hypothetical protein
MFPPRGPWGKEGEEAEVATGGPNGDGDEAFTNIDWVPSTKRPPKGGAVSRGCGDACECAKEFR